MRDTALQDSQLMGEIFDNEWDLENDSIGKEGCEQGASQLWDLCNRWLKVSSTEIAKGDNMLSRENQT